MKKAVIFDMDGLMFDSERATYEGYIEVCREYGCENFRESFLWMRESERVMLIWTVGFGPRGCRRRKAWIRSWNM